MIAAGRPVMRPPDAKLLFIDQRDHSLSDLRREILPHAILLDLA